MHERPLTVDRLTGTKALGVIRNILRLQPDIAELYFWSYNYVPQKSDEGGKPFWKTRQEILRSDFLKVLESELLGEEQVSLGSIVKIADGRILHIPMMDFCISKGTQGLETLKDRLNKLGIKNGWILESGGSYHFYGLDLFEGDQWLDFLGSCLLTSIVHSRDNIEQVADPRYIGHSLRRGCCALRVTSRGEKSFIPTVVDII